MKCPDSECSGTARVVLTTAEDRIVKRIRECDTCDTRFKTAEMMISLPATVKRKPRKAQRIIVRTLRYKGENHGNS